MEDNNHLQTLNLFFDWGATANMSRNAKIILKRLRKFLLHKGFKANFYVLTTIRKEKVLKVLAKNGVENEVADVLDIADLRNGPNFDVTLGIKKGDINLLIDDMPYDPNDKIKSLVLNAKLGRILSIDKDDVNFDTYKKHGILYDHQKALSLYHRHYRSLIIEKARNLQSPEQKTHHTKKIVTPSHSKKEKTFRPHPGQKKSLFNPKFVQLPMQRAA